MALVQKLSKTVQSMSGRWSSVSSQKLNVVKYSLLGGGVLTAGYVCYRGVQATKQHFQRQKIGYFLGGFSSALLLTGGYVVLRRYSFSSPEKIVNHVLPMLRANNEFRAAVGDNIRPGLFKAYAYVGGWLWKTPGTLGNGVLSMLSPIRVEPRTLQLMFQVNGTHSSAMVSLEVFRRTAEGLQFKSLAVDFANGERLLLKGKPDDVVFKGVTKLR